ncbi:hypothetical protein BpHYR1_023867 [Brachionus plicatilis]|uniref:Uncharacterized protein n=1 Tax=Brachionus plicatilis TaxID=10195 RepID=A0A3M7RNL1_BRAPC|nr:hypothetical protein BpHYR1_023867 [Brachionus plicatilis]
MKLLLKKIDICIILFFMICSNAMNVNRILQQFFNRQYLGNQDLPNFVKKAYFIYRCLRSSLSESVYPKRSYLAKYFFASEQSARNQNPSIPHQDYS